MYSSEHTSKVGPRAKCDQVVYEAIAKAAEIIVRGRCECQQGNGASGNSASTSTTTGGGSISRFHLEVEEVPLVRNILQMWRKCLHVPLRLDVYYEYCTDPAQPEQTTRKELLERWCIDYLPGDDHPSSMMSSQSSSSASASASVHSSFMSGPGGGPRSAHGHGHGQPRHYHPQQHHIHPNHQQQHHEEIIAQLRQVVKRVVILLRVLHSQTRLMPAYRLHHALMEDLQHFHLNYNRPIGSGPGLGGGYYNNNHHGTMHSHAYTNHHMGPSYSSSSSPSNNGSGRARDLVGGRINYSFYVSDDGGSGGAGASDSTATLFSSSTNSPFARHDLSPIPTPFGLLRFSTLYDDSLDVERVLTDRARRILKLGFGQHQQQQPPQGRLVGGENMMMHSRAKAIPIKNDSSHSVGYNEHLSQRYAAAAQIERPKSADPSRHEIRERLGSDPGHGLKQHTGKKVLSGLSLALMNEEAKTPQADNTTTTATPPFSGIEGATPPSPLLRPAISNDSANHASLKQRLAFHHPPPSYGDQGSLVGHAHSSLNSRGNSPIPTMPLVNTPPQPMFIGSFPRSLGTVRPGTPKDPPFCNPTSLLPSAGDGNSSSSTIPTGNGGALASPVATTVIPGNSTLLPPLNSQDALASNPFKSSVAQSMIATGGIGIGSNNLNHKEAAVGSVNASAFSSIVLGKGSAVYGPGDEGFPLALPSEGPSLMPTNRFGHSDYLSRSGNIFSNPISHREDDADDMPFVVELESSENEGGAISNISTPKLSRQNSAIDMSTTSSGTMSSQVVSSLAHRCSTAGRLRMFSENAQGGGSGSNPAGGKPVAEEDITSLTNQLADFRSFGESITSSSGLVPGGK